MNIRPNRVKRKLDAGEIAIVANGFDRADDVDAFGPSGFDGAWLEGEHGSVDPATIGDLTRACDVWGMTSIVRLNRNDQALIYRTFDLGAQGVVIPHVNTKEEAENVVKGGKFPPVGLRGVYTGRQGFGVSDYHHIANDETLLIILIEDIVAVQNLDEILEVDHIDVFLVAPSDLSASMGHIGNLQHREVQKTLDEAHQRIIASGRMAGALAKNEDVARYVSAGARFLLTASKHWIAAGAAEFKQRAEEAQSG